MGKMQSKPLVAGHDRAGERHGMCELAIKMEITGVPTTPELNPSEQRCLTRFFTGDFAS
jgi:hypothetical protein